MSDTDRLEIGRASAGILPVIGYIGRSPANSFGQIFGRNPCRRRAERISARTRPATDRYIIPRSQISRAPSDVPDAFPMPGIGRRLEVG